MTPLGQFSSKTTLNHLFVITILIVLPLISPSLLNKTHNGSGLILPLIPPTSPESPYYAQVLEANNISLTTTLNNVPLNRSHYFNWLKTLFIGDEKYSTVTYDIRAGYSTNIYVGTPPQLVHGLFDTGSDLIWFECKIKPGKPPNFNQLMSRTYKSIVCSNKNKCDSSTAPQLRCGVRNSCEFATNYADGAHVAGDMGTDIALTTIHGESLTAPQLMFGCTDDDPAKVHTGLIGAGNSKYAFPMQVSPNDPRFSYCLSSSMARTYTIKFGKEASLLGPSTELARNKFLPFYYLEVLGIKVQGTPINVPPYEYEMSPDGSRGFVIDSGTPLTYLSATIFDAVKAELEKLLGVGVPRSFFHLCYPISKFWKFGVQYKPSITIEFPEFEIVLSIDGTWTHTELPMKYQCLQILRTTSLYSILGIHSLWDVNVGHDPINNKLYLTRNDCT